MNRLQDLFNKPDGTKLMDTKLVMQIVDLPTTSSDKQAKTGAMITYFPVTMQHQGNAYMWELSPDQVSRIFTKKSKTGEVFWQGKNGDTVNVWFATNQKTPSRPYYAVEPLKDGEMYPIVTPVPTVNDTLALADEVFGDFPNEPTAVTSTQQTVVKPQFSKKPVFGDKPQWDGTPRQGNFRAGYAGLMQSILCNPNVNPFNPEHRDQARAVAEEEMLFIRKRAVELEATTQD